MPHVLEPDVIDNSIDGSLNVVSWSVCGEPDLGCVIKCSFAWQRCRDNVLLRHVAHLSAERVGVASRIQSADGDRSGRGLGKAKKRPHERCFSCAAGPKHADKFARLHRKRDAVEEFLFTIAILYRHPEGFGHNRQSICAGIHFFLASSIDCG